MKAVLKTILTGVCCLWGLTAQAQVQVFKSIVNDLTEVETGEVFTYKLQYRAASTTTDFFNATLVDQLPPELDYVSFNGTVHTDTFNVSGNLLSIDFIDPLPAGSTGDIEVKVRFKPGVTPDGTIALNEATMDADNSPPFTSDEVAITARAENKATVVKELLGSSIPLDQNVTYRVQVRNGTSVGALNLDDVALVDTLPPGAVFVSASNSGSYDAPSNTVTWPDVDLNAGSTLTRTVTVKFPAGDFALDDSVTNNVDVTYTPVGEPEVTDSDAVTHTIVAPSSRHRFWKGVSNNYVYEGKEAFKTWTFDLRNDGNVPLDNVVVTDQIPVELDLTRIRTGRTSGTPSGLSDPINVFYKSNTNGSWTALPGNPYSGSSASWVDVSSLGLGGSEYVTDVKWEFGTLPVGYRLNDTQLRTTVLTTDRNGDPVVEGQKILNNGGLVYTDFEGTTVTDDDDDDIDIRSPRPVVRLSKGASPSTVDDGGQTTYTVTLKNDILAARDLENPVLADLLDGKLEYVPGSYSIVSKPSGAPDPIFTVTNDYLGTGRTHLEWAWNGTSAYDLPIDEEIKISFKADIPAGTIYGGIRNNAVLTGFDNPVADRISTDEITDVEDLDGDGDVTEKFFAQDKTITVRGRASMDSIKWVKGELDSDWSKFPDSGRTVPGGQADYRLIVKNTGNVPIYDAVVLDILPVLGDTGVIDLAQRDTEWIASLAGPVVAPPGVTVYYSRSADPERLDFDPSGPAGSEDPLWSTTPPATIIEVRSLLFVFDSVTIQPAEEFEISWPMRAPVETPTDEEIAWNSFGYYGTREDTNSELLPSEPIKVGIKVLPDLNASYGDFVWLDGNRDGIQDPGEVGLNGIPVTLWQDSGPSGFPDGIQDPTYDIPVKSTITSDNFFGEPGYYLFPNLDRGDYYAVFDIPDAYTVSPKDAGSDDTEDSDVDPVTGRTVITDLEAMEKDLTWDLGLSLPEYSVDIVKTAGTAADGDIFWSNPGDPVTYTYVVTNTSPTLPLVRLTVTDDKLGLVNILDGPIEPGESVTVTKTSGSLSNGVVNIGDVTAYAADPTTKLEIAGAPPVTADDPAEVKLLASIGNFVWVDTDLDGVQDGNENGVSGVLVTLYDAAGNPIDTTTTNGQGKYLFDELFPGDYSVGFTPPNGYVLTKQDQGGNDAKDSDANQVSGRTINTTLEEGEEDLTWDAGIIETASLGDYVWWDYNANGLQDSSEDGLNGVTVNLLDAAGAPVLDLLGDPITTVTTTGSGGDGYYIFTGLTPGVPYRVEFVPASGLEFTVQNADSNGIDGAANSDADPTTGITDTVTLAGGEHNPNIDAGIQADPKIELLKEVDKTEYSVDGETLTYAFTVTNTGNVPLSNVVVTDPLFTVQGGPISLAVGEVDSSTFTGTYNVDLADLNAGSLPNTAKVVGTFDATGEEVFDTDDVIVPALQLPELALEKTGEIRIGSGNCDTLGPLHNFNALILGDFAAVGGDTDGRLAVGGHASIPSSYSVGIPVKGDPIPPIIGSDTDMFIVNGDLEDGVWGVNGNVVFGGTRTGPYRYQDNGNVTRQVIPVTFDANGNVPADGSGTTFEELEEYAEAAAALYGSLDDRGVVTVDDTVPYALTLEGNDPVLNIFNLTAEQWSSTSTQYTITAPPGSTVLINVHGSPINIVNGGMVVNGVSFRNILVNYVDATEVNMSGFTLLGSVLAPYADATFSGGGIDGNAIFGGNVASSNGFEFHNFPFEGSICVEVLYEFTVANVGNVTITDITIDDPKVTVDGGPIATMDPGESDGTTFTAVYNLKPEDIINGRFKNTAIASGQPPFGPRVTESDSHKLTFTVPGLGTSGFAGSGGSGGSGGGSGAGVIPPPGTPADIYSKADFVIEFVEFRGINPKPGDRFSAVVKVTNIGDLAGDAGTLRSWAHKASAPLAGEPADVELTIGELDPGESRTMRIRRLEVPAVTNANGYQNFIFRAFVDAAPTPEYSTYNEVAEWYDVTDPSATGGAADWMKADFIVTSVVLRPSPTVMGTRFDAVIRVKNEGDKDGDAGTLKLWAASPSYLSLDPNADETVAMGEIRAGRTVNFTFTDLEAPNVEGTFHTRVTVDADGVTDEYSEGNNQGGATYTVFPLKIRVKNLANGNNELRWKSAAGFTYTVERASSPAGPYAPIATGVSATPPKNTYEDTTVPPGVVFYRVWGSR